MTEPIEVEAKFICPSDLNLEALEKVLREAGLAVTWQQPIEQIDAYLDTPDQTLLNAGASLRVRRIGEQYVGTFKTPNGQAEGLFRRGELEWDLSPNDVQAWERGGLPTLPEEVARSLTSTRLCRILTVETVRQTARVNGQAGLVIELALDDTTFHGSKGSANHRELELELKAGCHAQLRHLADALRQRLALQASTESKFAAGMELVG